MKIVHASPGYGFKLTEEQTIEFLTNKKLNLLLGTVDKNGDPFIHPVWFLYENEKLYVETSNTSKKVQNIQHKNIVYFCIDEENLPYMGVRGKALVKVSIDVKDNIPVAERIMIKYTGNLENKVAKILMDGVRAGKSAILEINPVYYSTWDHSESQ
tara:strand:- start:1356 stop:1823 length:468 start_codon:yes stop_codon:yes gene_type:complete